MILNLGNGVQKRTKQVFICFDHSVIAVSGTDIKPSMYVKLLGVLIDDNLSLKSQVNKRVST